MRLALSSLALTALLATGCPRPSTPNPPLPPQNPPLAPSASAPPAMGAPAGGDATAPAAGATAPAPAASRLTPPPAEQQLEAKALPVHCGCALTEVGKCSEWAELDGKLVQITGQHGLGSMPFCGKKGLQAKVTGHHKDGKLHATKVEVVKQ